MNKGLDNNVLIYPHVLFWNINGRITFLTSNFLWDWLQKNFDIIFIPETHLCKNQKFILDNFKVYHNAYSDTNARKPRGGVSCLISTHFLQFIEEIIVEIPEIILIKFKGGDIIFGTYIPPVDSS